MFCHTHRLQVPASWPNPTDETQNLIQLEDPKAVNPKDPSLWKEVVNPKEIEFYLLLRNRRHFGQAQGTPFTQDSFTTRFNWAADSSAAEMVLNGQFNDSELNHIARLFLDNCRRITEVDEQPALITVQQFEGKVRAWRETTSTSPSGRHLGHYKALFARLDPTLPEDERVEMQQLQRNIAAVYVQLINYCIRFKYSLQRWKNVTNCMIYKEEGNTKIHQLRVIHIYEADLNLLLGLKWREVLWANEHHRTLNEGQFGSRPGREATTLSILEELRYDYSLSTRDPLVQVDKDATACYDRILVELSSLTGRKYGLHKNVIFVHATTLEEAEFRIKTAAGVSAVHYTHCPMFPIYGTGQGSGNSPTIWCFISSTLFDCHQGHAYGARFHAAD